MKNVGLRNSINEFSTSYNQPELSTPNNDSNQDNFENFKRTSVEMN